MTPQPQPYEHPVFGPIISTYTRSQAIEDGLLVDVSQTATEAGFRWPVALSRSLWEIVDNPPNGWEDSAGRLWDVLSMCRFAVRRSSGQAIRFPMILTRKAKRPVTDPWSKRYGKLQTVTLKNITLKAVISAESPTGSPCITIMLPDED